MISHKYCANVTLHFRTQRRISLCVLSFILFIIALTVGCKANNGEFVRASRNLYAKALETYQTGTFSQSTNAILLHLDYLKLHEKQISDSLDVNKLQYIGFAQLGYMSIYSGDATNACYYLDISFFYYKQMAEANHSTNLIAKSGFVEHVIDGFTKIDGNHRIPWKQAFSLDPNMINVTKKKFLNDGSSSESSE